MFKVGDRVRAIDNWYNITSKRNDWEGVVIQVDSYDGENIRVQTRSCKEGYIGASWWVESRHFEKCDYVKGFKKFINSLSENVKH